MTGSPWPLHGLRLRAPAVELQAMTEQHALALSAVVPDDVEHDPAHEGLGAGAHVLQSYWRAFGQWRVSDWVLPFVVLQDGRPVGLQALEGKEFPARRTVDSHSWLVPEARGQGLGRQMRAAVLTLAFDHLDAAWAVSEAWADNAASLGVSRSLGYVDNGVDVHAGGRLMQRLRLDRQRWLSPYAVGVSGLEACREWFGA